MGVGSDDFDHTDMPCPSRCKNCNGTGKIVDNEECERECPECLGEGTIWTWCPPRNK
jgi:DnaJ-class molecular chaperone